MIQGTSTPRVTVLGGGILGAATSVHLARGGARVHLVTQGAIADGASGRSLAWLNSFGRRSPAYHRLRVLGLDRYRTLAASPRSGSLVSFGGGLKWVAEDADPGLGAAFRHMQRIGYPVEWLTADDVARRVPGVDCRAVPPAGAVFAPGEGWVDLPALVQDLVRELVLLGGTVTTGAGPAEIVLVDGRVTAVSLGSGEVTGADAAVLATGADVPRTLANLGLRIPDASTAGLLVRTGPLRSALRAVLNTPRVAVRPTPDGALVLDSGWSEREVVTRDDGSFHVRDATVDGLLREASAVLEGNPRLVLDSYGVGPKPIPGGGEPVLGSIDGVPGYYVAFTHSGATLGLAVGELLAREVLTGEREPLLEPFRPGRFGETATP